MSDCNHKTVSDHSQPHGTGRLWQCSECSKVALWDDRWSHYGNYECRACGRAQIDWVACSDRCRDALIVKHKLPRSMTARAGTKIDGGDWF